MSSDYIKLTDAPVLVYQSPTCSACCVDLESEDGWVCPVCGTSWTYDQSDGDSGEMYESWSGETLETEPIETDEAWKAGMDYQRTERERLFKRLGLRL